MLDLTLEEKGNPNNASESEKREAVEALPEADVSISFSASSTEPSITLSSEDDQSGNLSRQELIDKIDEIQQINHERLYSYYEQKSAYQELRQRLNPEDPIPEEVFRVEKAIEALKELRLRLEGASEEAFSSSSAEMQAEYGRWARMVQDEVRWDVFLIALLKPLREDMQGNPVRPLLAEQIAWIRDLVEKIGLKLIWPAPGDELVMREHKILREEEAEGVKRGQVIRALTPGLQGETEVFFKAGIVMAR